MQQNRRVGIAIDRTAESDAYDRERVAALVRRAIQYGGYEAHPDAPLREIIQPGQTVLLKPNWVLHFNQANAGMECMVTHPSVIYALLTEVLAARPGRVILGDAPVQSCDFDALVPEAFRSMLHELAGAAGVALEIVDFRRTVLKDGTPAGPIEENARPLDRYALFDLGESSLLEEITTDDARFRVGDYDPRALASTHAPGRHQYLICREALEADVVISIPKLKTHRKAGLTAALKNLVGLNGNKDYLPHHRYGGSARGGDCYEGASAGKHLSEWLDDRANLRIGRSGYTLLRQSARAVRLISGGSGGRMRGSWWGNDTTWRMVLDLNRIAAYGTADGEMKEERQRAVYTLTDAIICGQGDGPLHPEPHFVGAVTFGSDPVALDRAHAALMGFDPDRLALIRNGAAPFRWPLVDSKAKPQFCLNNELLDLHKIALRWSNPARPAQGWVNAVEALREIDA